MRSIRSALVVAAVGGMLWLPSTSALAQPEAATHLVAQDGSGDFTTISEAVAAAAAGDTILIAAGTYDESVSVDRDVTITGDGERETVIVAPSTGTASFTLTESDAALSGVTLRGRHATVVVSGGAPTLEDLFFDMVGVPFDGSSGVDAVSVSDGSTALIRGNTFVEWGGLGVYSGAAPRFEGNDITGGSNIFIEETAGAAEVVGNTIRDQRIRGMWVGASATALIEGNTIIDPAEEGIVYGADGLDTDLVIRGNTIAGGTIGIHVADAGSPMLEGNDVSGASAAGIQVDAADEPQLLANAVHDNEGSGVVVMRGTTTLSGNSVTKNEVGLLLGPGAAPTLSGNTVCDNTTNVRVLGDGEMPDATGNEVCPDAIAAKVDEGEVAPAETTVTAVEHLGERMVDLTIDSPSVGEAKVRLLLPAGLEDDPDASWPVLLLLHGQGGSYASWTTESDVADLTSDLDLLVVMPDGGSGWYSDWWNGGEGGPPAWETFHLSEVLDIVERDWRASDERIVAGLSMGGYGAVHYATAHPELFRAAASFSGLVDPVGSDFFHDYLLWGDRVEQADIWAAHDPVGMADALAGKPLFLSWGTGQPGLLDPPDATFDDVEAWVQEHNEALVARLTELGIDVVTESGPGTHSLPYWEQSLHHALPLLLGALEG